MNALQTTDRLKIYVNYGVVGFLTTFVLLEILYETLMMIMPLIFNAMICKKLSYTKRTIIIAIVSWLTTTLLFILQFEYKNQIEWGCIKTISNETSNLNYSSTMIFFSIIFWEIGFSVFHKRQPDKTFEDSVKEINLF